MKNLPGTVAEVFQALIVSLNHAWMSNATELNRLWYDRLAGYSSYDLAWLGPIVYPLSLALIAQASVYLDMVRHRFASKAATDPRVECTVLLVMLAESIFAVSCIWQCIVNYANRAFMGGADACDVQAFYATYYNFASLVLAAYGTLIASLFVTSGGNYRWLTLPAVVGGGAAIHAAALLVASVPLMGAQDIGGYEFAQDYCMYRVEGSFYATLLLATFFACVAVVAVSVAKVCVWANVDRSSGSSASSHDADRADRSYRRCVRNLALLSGLYFVAINMVSVIIALLYVVDGAGSAPASGTARLTTPPTLNAAAYPGCPFVMVAVLGTPNQSIYGKQALILHSNQLFVPVLFGWKWRAAMQAAASRAEARVSANLCSLGKELTPSQPQPTKNTELNVQATPQSLDVSVDVCSPPPSAPSSARHEGFKVAWEA